MFSVSQAIFKGLIFFFAVSAVLVYSDTVVISEDSGGQSLTATGGEGKSQQEKLAEIQEELQARRKEFERISAAERSVIAELNRIDTELSTARRRAETLESELVAIDREIDLARNEMAKLEAHLAETEQYASQRLVALYKLSWLGKINILASADSAHEFIRRKSALKAILDHDQRIIRRLVDAQQRVRTLHEALNRDRAQKLVLEKAHQQEIRQVSQKRRQKKALLEKIATRKSLQLAAIEALDEAAAELDRAIASLDMGQTDPGRPSPAKNFSTYKGLLEMPVRGKVLHRFGKYRNTELGIVNFRSGIDIEAEAGDPVHAVCDGRVLFASWLKGYGNMIIIEHGDHYYTVYAHAEELFKQQGDAVETGEVIATVGDTGTLDGTAKLYFEIRHHETPMDPLPWLK